MSEDPVHAKMLIAGIRENGKECFEVRNPANPDEVVGTAARGTAADAQRAIAAAKAAQPAWAKRTFAERAHILTQALDRFAAGTEARARGNVPLFVENRSASVPGSDPMRPWRAVQGLA